MAYTVDTKVGEILKDGRDSIVNILQKDIPLIAAIKEMSLQDLLAIPQVKQLGITEAMVNGVLAQINARSNSREKKRLSGETRDEPLALIGVSACACRHFLYYLPGWKRFIFVVDLFQRFLIPYPRSGRPAWLAAG